LENWEILGKLGNFAENWEILEIKKKIGNFFFERLRNFGKSRENLKFLEVFGIFGNFEIFGILKP
jgi:hypothetical protein